MELSLNTKGENNPMYGITGENHPSYGIPRPQYVIDSIKEMRARVGCPLDLLTPEQLEIRNKKVSEGIKLSWENSRSKEEAAKTQSDIWANRSEDELDDIYSKISQTLLNKTSEQRAEILAKSRATYAKRIPLVCPHCLLSSKSGSNMKRYHFDACKVNPNRLTK